MKHDFFTVTKKEFKRFFGDKRLFFSTVILPGLMIFIIYSIMGNVMKEAFSPDEKYNAPLVCFPRFFHLKSVPTANVSGQSALPC